jgi:hypothetical protein
VESCDKLRLGLVRLGGSRSGVVGQAGRGWVLRRGKAVLVRSGEVGYVPVGHGVVRLGKAVMAWKGYFRHGLSWYGG